MGENSAISWTDHTFNPLQGGNVTVPVVLPDPVDELVAPDGSPAILRKPKLKIGFIPAYTPSAASSRLRVFAIAVQLERLGLAEPHLGLGNNDLHVFQKVNMRSVADGFPAWENRLPVVFDIDDDLPDLYSAAFCRSHLVTVDSQPRLARVLRWNFVEQVGADKYAIKWFAKYPVGRVLPDMIDYNPTSPLPAAPEFNKLAWFGNRGNFNLEPMLHAVARQIPFEVIGDGADPATTLSWNFNTFAGDIRACGVALLSHKGQDQAKSNNKLIAAVTLGVPCIVMAGSPEYERTLREVGLDIYVCHNSHDLRESINELRSLERRQMYLEAIQGHVWESYRPEVIARRAFELYKEAIEIA